LIGAGENGLGYVPAKTATAIDLGPPKWPRLFAGQNDDGCSPASPKMVSAIDFDSLENGLGYSPACSKMATAIDLGPLRRGGRPEIAPARPGSRAIRADSHLAPTMTPDFEVETLTN
jgi:hypothetical protein